MFKKSKIALSVVAGVMGVMGIMTSAEAVHVNPDGTGQALIFPYFNAKDKYITNINLVNSTDKTKAVKIHFRESKTSKDMFDFNIYMSPNDVWTATLKQSQEPDKNGNYVGSLTTTDRTCTLPLEMAASCEDGRCETTKNFHGYEVFGINASDTQEGYVEVIEMGVVEDSLVKAGVLHHDGAPADCTAVANAWSAKRFTEGAGASAQGMSAPTGGLFGHSAILNIEKGTAFAIDPVAIDNYSTQAQHYLASSPVNFGLPSLASGDVTTSTILTGSEMVETTWKPFTKDACLMDGDDLTPACGKNPYPMAHVLTAPYVMNEYFVDPSADYDGHTDWVMTFPMKKYGIAWKDKKEITDTATALTIDEMNSRDGSLVLAGVFQDIYDREEGMSHSNTPIGENDFFGFVDFSPTKCPAGSSIFDKDKDGELGTSGDACCPTEYQKDTNDDSVPDMCDNPTIVDPCVEAGTCAELRREVNVLTFLTTDPGYDASYSVLSSGSDINPLSVGEFVSGWARLSFKGYGLSAGFDSAKAYGANAVDPVATDSLYEGVPVVGAAFIQGKVVDNPAGSFGDALPHKFQRD